MNHLFFFAVLLSLSSPLVFAQDLVDTASLKIFPLASQIANLPSSEAHELASLKEKALKDGLKVPSKEATRLLELSMNSFINADAPIHLYQLSEDLTCTYSTLLGQAQMDWSLNHVKMSDEFKGLELKSVAKVGVKVVVPTTASECTLNHFHKTLQANLAAQQTGGLCTVIRNQTDFRVVCFNLNFQSQGVTQEEIVKQKTKSKKGAKGETYGHLCGANGCGMVKIQTQQINATYTTNIYTGREATVTQSKSYKSRTNMTLLSDVSLNEIFETAQDSCAAQ